LRQLLSPFGRDAAVAGFGWQRRDYPEAANGLQQDRCRVPDAFSDDLIDDQLKAILSVRLRSLKRHAALDLEEQDNPNRHARPCRFSSKKAHIPSSFSSLIGSVAPQC
jgi:hypothetical protein